MAIRAEVLKKIMNDADEAKPIAGTHNVYSPDEYSKIAARQQTLAALEDPQDGYLHARIGEGEVEFDERGNLKKIGRTQPKLIDPRSLTANRYMKDIVKPGTPGLRPGTYILVAFGAAIVRAIGENQTLTPQVKVHRFRYSQADNAWEYVRAELIEDKKAYLMTSQLDAPSALSLIHKVEASQVSSAEVEGDSLDAILTKSEKNEDTTDAETDS